MIGSSGRSFGTCEIAISRFFVNDRFSSECAKISDCFSPTLRLPLRIALSSVLRWLAQNVYFVLQFKGYLIALAQPFFQRRTGALSMNQSAQRSFWFSRIEFARHPNLRNRKHLPATRSNRKRAQNLDVF